MLSGARIVEEILKGNIIISPFDEENVGPNSYDMTLNPIIKTYSMGGPLDMKKDNPIIEHQLTEDGFLLFPNNLYLACTNESAGSTKFVPCIDGRSSVGRLGIQIHMTAGRGDLGYIGKWTLEIQVARPVRIYPNIRICQIYFYPILLSTAEISGDSAIQLYKGKYLNTNEPIHSRMFKDREFIGHD